MVRASVALIDEQPLFLAGLASLLGKNRYSVAGTAHSFNEARELIRVREPNVLITEIDPLGDVVAALREVQRLSKTTRTIICTARADVDTAVRALDGGAHGYILKGSSEAELLAALDAVLHGETFINQCFAVKIISSLREAAMLKAAAQKDQLTLREQQIVQHLLRGRTNREIAQSLSISEKTVKHYMTIIMQKLHARNRLEVVIAAQTLSGQSPGGVHVN